MTIPLDTWKSFCDEVIWPPYFPDGIVNPPHLSIIFVFVPVRFDPRRMVRYILAAYIVAKLRFESEPFEDRHLLDRLCESRDERI
jgi:hypothetical protein